MLGDRYRESSYVTEKLAYGLLTEPKVTIRHIEDVVAELTRKKD